VDKPTQAVFPIPNETENDVISRQVNKIRQIKEGEIDPVLSTEPGLEPDGRVLVS